MEKIAVGLQQQQEVVADLDVKVDATAETVVTIGDKVIEHDKEIGELGVGLEKVEERVEDVEENVGDTKVKVEGIDNKVKPAIAQCTARTVWSDAVIRPARFGPFRKCTTQMVTQ